MEVSTFFRHDSAANPPIFPFAYSIQSYASSFLTVEQKRRKKTLTAAIVKTYSVRYGTRQMRKLILYLNKAILKLWWFSTGYWVACGQTATPVASGLTGPLLLSLDVETLVAAVSHHCSEAVVGPTSIAIANVGRLSTANRDALDGQRRRIPLAPSKAFNLGCSVQNKALHALEAHDGASCKPGFTNGLQNAVRDSGWLLTEISYAVGHVPALWRHPLPFCITKQLRVISQAVAIRAEIISCIAKKAVATLW